MIKSMTPRERWLSAIRLEPVDRLPFWPKVSDSYIAQHDIPFTKMDVPELHDWIGSDPHIWLPNCVKEVSHNVSKEVTVKEGVRKSIYKTGLGDVEAIDMLDAPSGSWHPVKMPVNTIDDINIMIEWYSGITVELDKQNLGKAMEIKAFSGESAVFSEQIGTSPLMYFIEYLAGAESGNYLLTDHRGEVEELFNVMQQILIKKAEIKTEYSPADLLYLIENTSTTLISPTQFQTYCLQHFGEYENIVKGADRFLVLHMCGHLKSLLPDMALTSANAFEAFTSPTLGNTTLLDGRSICPDKCLIGGTNAIQWTGDADTIINQLEADLDVLPHHRGLVITSAGVMPPVCKPETIKEVCAWLKSYRIRV